MCFSLFRPGGPVARPAAEASGALLDAAVQFLGNVGDLSLGATPSEREVLREEPVILCYYHYCTMMLIVILSLSLDICGAVLGQRGRSQPRC